MAPMKAENFKKSKNCQSHWKRWILPMDVPKIQISKLWYFPYCRALSIISFSGSLGTISSSFPDFISLKLFWCDERTRRYDTIKLDQNRPMNVWKTCCFLAGWCDAMSTMYSRSDNNTVIDNWTQTGQTGFKQWTSQKNDYLFFIIIIIIRSPGLPTKKENCKKKLYLVRLRTDSRGRMQSRAANLWTIRERERESPYSI